MLSLGRNMVKAQQEPVFSQYEQIPTIYNPARAGEDTKVNIAFAYNMQLAGFENAPKTMFVQANMQLPLGKTKHGVGANLIRDNIGSFSFGKLALQYNYQLAIGKGKLALGGQLDMHTAKIQANKLEPEQTNDPAIPTADANGSKLDASVGIAYYYKTVKVSGAWLHVTQPVLTLAETYLYPLYMTFVLNGSYIQKLSHSNFSILPSFFVLYNKMAYVANLNAKLNYHYEQKDFFIGAGYSVNRAVCFQIGAQIKGATLGYVYEAYTSKLAFTNGGHEIVLAYSFPLDLTKKQKQKHLSIRLL